MEGRPTAQYGCGSSQNSLTLSANYSMNTNAFIPITIRWVFHSSSLNYSAEPYFLNVIYFYNSHTNTERQKGQSENCFANHLFQFGGGLVEFGAV